MEMSAYKKTAKQANTRKSASPTLPRVADMEQRAIEAVIPANAKAIPSPVPMHRFRYDAKHDTLKCPRQDAEGGPCRHGRHAFDRSNGGG
ncbi:hypothetical protein CN137_19330 [Sinorhizobium meliloti]|nr:hypothetical protein CN137_19330 [Sinorhizobium meliloti]